MGPVASKLILVLGGNPPPSAWLQGRLPVYGADAGALACLAARRKPELVVGDFDSVDPARLPADWDLRHRPDQNHTDFEKLLAELPPGFTDLTILGGFGDRTDHEWNNRLIAAAIDPAVRVRFLDPHEQLLRVTPLCSVTCEPGPVSLLPVGVVHGGSSQGLAWNLSGQTLGAGRGISQSNVAGDNARVRVDAGVLYVWSRTKKSPAEAGE